MKNETPKILAYILCSAASTLANRLIWQRDGQECDGIFYERSASSTFGCAVARGGYCAEGVRVDEAELVYKRNICYTKTYNELNNNILFTIKIDKMKFNSRNIKKSKGMLILLTYKTNGNHNSITGEITASTRSHILFNVNKTGPEIPISYENIINIEKPVK